MKRVVLFVLLVLGSGFVFSQTAQVRLTRLVVGGEDLTYRVYGAVVSVVASQTTVSIVYNNGDELTFIIRDQIQNRDGSVSSNNVVVEYAGQLITGVSSLSKDDTQNGISVIFLYQNNGQELIAEITLQRM